MIEHGKIQPQNQELEEVVLGAILLEPDALDKIYLQLKPEYFYNENNKKVYSAILSLKQKNADIDIITVTNELKLSGELDLIGGAYYIAQLTNRVASSSNVEYHTSIIIDEYINREFIRLTAEYQNNAYLSNLDIIEFQKKIEDLKNLIYKEPDKNNVFVSEEVFANMQKRKEIHDSGETIGITTGIFELNKLIYGWEKQLYLIAARPSVGKTSLVLHHILKAAQVGYSVRFYSLEMSHNAIHRRLTFAVCEADIDLMKQGKGTDEDLYNFKISQNNINKLNISIIDRASITIDELCRDAKQQKKNKNLDILFIDHLQILRGSEKKQSEIDRLTEIGIKLHSLQKELEIPIIALHQLSRDIEGREVRNKKPILKDLRGCGTLEENADVIMFIYRPAYYEVLFDSKTNESYENYGEIIIRKNRDGRLGTARFNHNYSMTQIYDYGYKAYVKPINNEIDEEKKPF